MIQYLNKKISSPVAIGIILILSFFLIWEIFWQYSGMQREVNWEVPKANI